MTLWTRNWPGIDGTLARVATGVPRPAARIEAGHHAGWQGLL